MSSILDQISAPPASAAPPAIPDPQPHLAPSGGGGDPASALAAILSGGDPGSGPGDPSGGPYGHDPAQLPLPVDPASTPPGTTGDPAAAHATKEISHLKDMLGLAHDYMSIPTVEPSEAHAMSKAVSIITKILADNQQMNDQAGSSPALRKATGGGGY